MPEWRGAKSEWRGADVLSGEVQSLSGEVQRGEWRGPECGEVLSVESRV